jgi:hypothetical protein
VSVLENEDDDVILTMLEILTPEKGGDDDSED